VSINNTTTITMDDLLANTDDDNITLSGWNSPLTTSLSDTDTITGTAGTVVNTLSGIANNWNWTNSTMPYTINSVPSIMKVECDAEFHGEVTIRGVKLDERLNAIEERLGILRPNNDLEGRWEKLKALGEEYRKLEQEFLEGEDIWATLKK
jgi:hypothetical protein